MRHNSEERIVPFPLLRFAEDAFWHVLVYQNTILVMGVVESVTLNDKSIWTIPNQPITSLCRSSATNMIIDDCNTVNELYPTHCHLQTNFLSELTAVVTI